VLSELVKNNYKEILDAAKNITRRNNYQYAKDLINDAYILISEKNYPKDNQGFIQFYTTVMYNMNRGERSSFRKAIKPLGVELKIDVPSNDHKSIETLAEITNENTKELINELSHLTREKAIKFSAALEFKDSLSPHQRTLFEYCYEQELSVRDIADKMEIDHGQKMSHMRIWRMVNEIKSELNKTKELWLNI